VLVVSLFLQRFALVSPLFFQVVMDKVLVHRGLTTLDVLVASGLVSSRSEGRRLIDQNGVKLEETVLKDPNERFPGAGVLRVGKRKFLRIVH
jgi:tyrosyl-tRNA synthetase